jgi:hypothetical protein
VGLVAQKAGDNMVKAFAAAAQEAQAAERIFTIDRKRRRRRARGRERAQVQAFRRFIDGR